MLSLKDLFFSKILLMKKFVTNIQIIEGVSAKEELQEKGIEKSLGDVLLDEQVITKRQYEAVMAVQRQTLLTCKNCGMKYELNELSAVDEYKCEVCEATVIHQAELASLNLAPLFDKSSSDSRVESSSFLLESSGEHWEGAIQIEKPVLTPLPGRTDPPSNNKKKTTTLRFQSVEDESLALIGQEIAGYRIDEKIGEGGSCVVFQAHDMKKDEQVAMKILKSNPNVDEERIVGRLMREAKVAGSIRHPNIIHIRDSGDWDGYYYIIMEYVNGETLREKILKTHIFELDEAMAIIEQVLEGLAAAHQKHFIHRDIKPDNIMVTPEGQAKITDFGLARGMHIDAHLTQTGQIIGTPYYMSPEQAQSHKVDHRSDLYSLGATFYYIITGRVPFEGSTPIEIILKHISKAPDPPSKFNKTIPPEISQIVEKMMTKDRNERYQTAEDVLEDLRRFTKKAKTAIRNKPAEKPAIDYPDWKDFILGQLAIRDKVLSQEQVARSLADLMSMRRTENKSLLQVWKGLGVTRETWQELENQLHSEIDMRNFSLLFGQIALRNKLISKEQLLSILYSQHSHQGKPPPMGEIMLEKKILSEQQRDAILLAQLRYVVNKFDNALAVLLVEEQFLSPQQIRNLSKELEKCNKREICQTLPQILLEKNILDDEKLDQYLYRCFYDNLTKTVFV